MAALPFAKSSPIPMLTPERGEQGGVPLRANEIESFVIFCRNLRNRIEKHREPLKLLIAIGKNTVNIKQDVKTLDSLKDTLIELQEQLVEGNNKFVFLISKNPEVVELYYQIDHKVEALFEQIQLPAPVSYSPGNVWKQVEVIYGLLEKIILIAKGK